MRAVKKLAVTGGIAEGKSTVVGFLRDLGVSVVSADDTARELWNDPRIQDQISVRLGLPVPLSREAVREQIAEDPLARRAVNQVFHLPVTERLLQHPAQVAEVPLLIEACLQSLFDHVWVVTCGPEIQMERLVERVGNRVHAELLIETQLATCVKCAFADHVIRTDQPLSTVKHVVEALAREHDLVAS